MLTCFNLQKNVVTFAEKNYIIMRIIMIVICGQMYKNTNKEIEIKYFLKKVRKE